LGRDRRSDGGQDAAPRPDLGDLGWFAVSWLVMKPAVILPSVLPAAPASRAQAGRTGVAYGVVATLAVLAVWIAVAPGNPSGLTLPGSMGGT
jgi:hypothetical protein